MSPRHLLGSRTRRTGFTAGAAVGIGLMCAGVAPQGPTTSQATDPPKTGMARPQRGEPTYALSEEERRDILRRGTFRGMDHGRGDPPTPDGRQSMCRSDSGPLPTD